MATPGRKCIFSFVRGQVTADSVYGGIPSTRQDAVAFVKDTLPSLSSAEDGLLEFSVDGHRIPDKPGVWEITTDDLPSGTEFKITLRVDQIVKQERRDKGSSMPVGDDGRITIEVIYTPSSPTSTLASAHSYRCPPTMRLRRVFAHCARDLRRDVLDLEFSFDGRALLDDQQRCAEVGIGTGARIQATDKAGSSTHNAVAGTSTGPGTQNEPRTSTLGLAVGAEEICRPLADYPPRPSAPIDDPTADQRPVSDRPAQQHSATATSVSAVAPAPPAAQSANVDLQGRASPAVDVANVGVLRPTTPTPSASARASSTLTSLGSQTSSNGPDCNEEAEPSAKARGKKRASGDFNESDGDAGGSSPSYSKRPTKKKARGRRAVMGSQIEDLDEEMDQVGDDGTTTTPASVTARSSARSSQRCVWISVALVYSSASGNIVRFDPCVPNDISLAKLFKIFATHASHKSGVALEPLDLVFSLNGVELDGGQTCAEAGVDDGARINVTDKATGPDIGNSSYHNTRLSWRAQKDILADNSHTPVESSRCQSAPVPSPAWAPLSLSAAEAEPEAGDGLVYCICDAVYEGDRFMIACDRCDEWFHPSCIGLNDDLIKPDDDFVCPWCIDRVALLRLPAPIALSPPPPAASKKHAVSKKRKRSPSIGNKQGPAGEASGPTQRLRKGDELDREKKGATLKQEGGWDSEWEGPGLFWKTGDDAAESAFWGS